MVTLSELWERHEEAWAAYISIPWDERKYGQQAPHAREQMKRLEDIKTRIAEHPDFRSFEKDLTESLGDEIRAAKSPVGWYSEENGENVAVNVYQALTNVEWEHELGTQFSCSFRAAGGIIASIRGEGDYLDWYCSGLEGVVSDEINDAMAAKGWKHKE